MLDEQFRNLQQDASAVTQEWRRQEYDRDIRVGTWLLVGNGAALLLCFSASIGGEICDWSSVRWLATAFFFGMVWALSSVVLEGEVINRASMRMLKIGGAARQAMVAVEANAKFAALDSHTNEVAQREAKNAEVIKEAFLTLEKEREEPAADKLLQLQANICRGLSAVTLGGSILFAIWSPVIGTARCGAGS
ncbi:MAG: hypothetical protein K2P58_00025 [Hyphomonadaceae bacterium]|nr:hypothetical protein [Hyphomonadaceae bacterium]